MDRGACRPPMGSQKVGCNRAHTHDNIRSAVRSIQIGSQMTVPFAFSSKIYENSNFSKSFTTYVIIWLFSYIGVKWYITVVLTCISLIANHVEHLVMYLLIFLYIFFGKNICLDYFPI